MHDILDAGLLVHVLPDRLDRNIRGACCRLHSVFTGVERASPRTTQLERDEMVPLISFAPPILLQLTRISRLELHDDKITGVIPGKRCGGKCGGGKFEIDLPDDSPMSIQDLVSFSCR